MIFFVGIVYGLIPTGFFDTLFELKFNSVDSVSVYRALMGLYMAIGTFWVIGIIRPEFWIAATLSNVLFMVGLALGRTISICIDGLPSNAFLVGLIVEIIFAIWGIRNIVKYKL